MEFADAPDVARIEAQPFLKWAGAKAQLLQQFDKFFPAAMDRYFEPFLGGGAVFFHLKRRFPGMRAFLRDNNADRETYYYLIRSQHHPPAIAGRARPLGAPKAVSSSQSAARPAVAPYQQPIQNDESWQADIIIERAARFIFLNKTCFNGLWRVKARGEFNVPIGSHKNPALYDRDNLLAAQRSVRLMLSN
jgi:DNA adenine methylase